MARDGPNQDVDPGPDGDSRPVEDEKRQSQPPS